MESEHSSESAPARTPTAPKCEDVQGSHTSSEETVDNRYNYKEEEGILEEKKEGETSMNSAQSLSFWTATSAKDIISSRKKEVRDLCSKTGERSSLNIVQSEDTQHSGVKSRSSAAGIAPSRAAIAALNLSRSTVDSSTVLEVPLPRPSVRRGMTPDGRKAWMLFSPRKRNNSNKNKNINSNHSFSSVSNSGRRMREMTESMLEDSEYWEKKIVAPPPDHLPRRVLNALAAARLSAQRGDGTNTPRVVRPNVPVPAHNVEPQKNVLSNDTTSLDIQTEVPSSVKSVREVKKVDEVKTFKGVNEVVPVSPSANVQGRRKREKTAASTGDLLNTLLLPVSDDEDDTNESGNTDNQYKIFPKEAFSLPREWRMNSELSSPPDCVLPVDSQQNLTYSSGYRKNSHPKKVDVTQGVSNFPLLSVTTQSESSSFDDVHNNNGLAKELHKNTTIGINEDDYIKAYFHLNPLPLHDNLDINGYNLFLMKNGVTGTIGTTGTAFDTSPRNSIYCERQSGGIFPEEKRASQFSTVQLKQQEREAAGKYGLWCTVDIMIGKDISAGTTTLGRGHSPSMMNKSGKRRTDFQAPKWCMQICGGVFPRLDSNSLLSLRVSDTQSDTSALRNTIVSAYFEAVFFTQPPDNPSSVFGTPHIQSAAAVSTPPIYTLPLTPRLLNATEATPYKWILLQERQSILLRHQQEERFVFGERSNKKELFLLYTQVIVSKTQKYSLNVNVLLFPCRQITTKESRFKTLSTVEVLEVPLFYRDTVSASTRCVYSAVLTFSTKSAFLKAYKALLWACEVNTISVRNALGVPLQLQKNDNTNNSSNKGNFPYVSLRLFASRLPRSQPSHMTEYRRRSVQHIASVLMNPLSPIQRGNYRLEDFYLEPAHSHDQSRPRSLSSLSPSSSATHVFSRSLASVVAVDAGGVVHRVRHLPSSQCFDVRVMPRQQTRLLWAAADERDQVGVMEAALVLEYLSRMPFQNPIVAVLSDANKFYIVQAPLFSALVENRGISNINHQGIQLSPGQSPQFKHFGIIPLSAFMDHVLRTSKATVDTRWNIARILAAQLLLAIITLHGKGALLGPISARQLYVQWDPVAISSFLENADDVSIEKNELKTSDFHLLIPGFGIHTDVWEYERQQLGVVEYVSPRYLFNIAHSTAVSKSERVPWTVGDDYWFYLCIIFELFSAENTTLLSVQPQEQYDATSASTSFRDTREIWELWKDVFTTSSSYPFSPSSPSSYLHRDDYHNREYGRGSGILKALQHYVQSRLETSVLPSVNLWISVEEQKKSAERESGVFTSGNSIRNNRSERSRAISLADAYIDNLRSQVSQSDTEVKRKGVYDEDIEKKEEAKVRKDLSSTCESMKSFSPFCQLLVDKSLELSTVSVNNKVRLAASNLLVHPFFLDMDFASLFDGDYMVPHASFLCKKLSSKRVFSDVVNKIPLESRRESLSLRKQQHQQRTLSPSGTEEPQSGRLIPSSSEEGEEEGGVSRTSGINSVTVTTPRSTLGDIKRIYAPQELEDINQIRQDVSRVVNHTLCSDAAETFFVTTPRQDQEQVHMGDSQAISPTPSLTKRNPKEPSLQQEENNMYVSAWRRLRERAGESAASVSLTSETRDYYKNDMELPVHRRTSVPNQHNRHREYNVSSTKSNFALTDPLLNRNIKQQKQQKEKKWDTKMNEHYGKDNMSHSKDRSRREKSTHAPQLKERGPFSVSPTSPLKEEKNIWTRDNKFLEDVHKDESNKKKGNIVSSDSYEPRERKRLHQEYKQEKDKEYRLRYSGSNVDSFLSEASKRTRPPEKCIDLQSVPLPSRFSPETTNVISRSDEISVDTNIKFEPSKEKVLATRGAMPTSMKSVGNRKTDLEYVLTNSRVSYSSSSFMSSPQNTRSIELEKFIKKKAELQKNEIVWELVGEEHDDNDDLDEKEGRYNVAPTHYPNPL
ncbi:hypothetical protein LSM04_000679 [Trypanosoma melophagium]|uniref:uncharacterized protein n=1 Tax=Trypanosoma melophagium TaxID=715481 RepID=UPI00351A135F|nr:hypothetical protein LSM04_000679 [Trypanosoma melophagium]